MEKKIVNKKTNNKLIIKGATADMAGSCTCFVKGIGSQDSAEITVEAQGLSKLFGLIFCRDVIKVYEKAKRGAHGR